MVDARTSFLPPGLRAEYPFVGRTFELPAVNGEGAAVRMHYLDEGVGPVVCLLHGNPTWSFFYRKLIVHLRDSGFRCIAPDHIGCGLSDTPRNRPYTLEQRIRDVEHLLDYLEIKRFSLVLHDWGGAIGCGLATRRTEQIEKLVLLNTAAFTSLRLPWRIALLKIPLLGEWIIRGLNGFVLPATWMAVQYPLSPNARAGYLWPYASWEERLAVWKFVQDIPLRPSHPSYRVLRGIETALPRLSEKPAGIFWGGKDFCFNDHFLERWRKIFPRAHVRVFPDAGHYVLEDAGGEATDAIREFLLRGEKSPDARI